MPRNKSYKLVVLFDSYTGNYHKQFNAFVLGVGQDYPDKDIDRLVKIAEKALGLKNDDAIDDYQEFFHYFHDEYGSNVSELSHYVKKEGTTGITVHFEKDPSKYIPIYMEQLASIRSICSKVGTCLKVELIEETIKEKTIFLHQISNKP